MITIYSTYQTARLSYALDFCFKDKGVDYQLIQNKSEWDESSTQSINYTSEPLTADLQIYPQGILFESDIYPSKKLDYNNGEFLLDGVCDELGIIFFLLTNYFEYFNQDRDQHDRYQSKNHPLVKLNKHTEPVVDQLVKDIWGKLGLEYETVAKGFKLQPTFDIDIAWAYKERPLKRAIGGAIKGGKPIERLQVLAGSKKDPYDTFDSIKNIAANHKETTCFYLLGDYGPYDKNIAWDNKAYQSLINEMDQSILSGIHPSYQSYLDSNQIKVEKKRLEIITKKQINRSRQHFLRLSIPRSYKLLIDVGINNDYSMGFADNVGFRSGTSFPYSFFDLTKNEKTSLIVHPFAYVDSAFKDYLKLTAEESIPLMKEMKSKIKEVGGTFCFIWHNSSIHNTGEWSEWRAVLDKTLENEA